MVTVSRQPDQILGAIDIIAVVPVKDRPASRKGRKAIQAGFGQPSDAGSLSPVLQVTKTGLGPAKNIPATQGRKEEGGSIGGMGQQGQHPVETGNLKPVIMPPDKEVGKGQLGDLGRVFLQEATNEGLMG
jgi:hypothetical protein